MPFIELEHESLDPPSSDEQFERKRTNSSLHEGRYRADHYELGYFNNSYEGNYSEDSRRSDDADDRYTSEGSRTYEASPRHEPHYSVSENEDFSQGMTLNYDEAEKYDAIKATWSTFTESLASSSEEIQKTFSNLMIGSKENNGQDGTLPDSADVAIRTRSSNSTLTTRSGSSSQSRTYTLSEMDVLYDPDTTTVHSMGSWADCAGSRDVSLIDRMGEDSDEDEDDDEGDDDDNFSDTSSSTDYSNVNLNDFSNVMYQIGSCNLRPEASLSFDEDYNDFSGMLPPAIAKYVGRTRSTEERFSEDCDDASGEYTCFNGAPQQQRDNDRRKSKKKGKKKKKSATGAEKIISVMKNAFSCGASAAF